MLYQRYLNLFKQHAFDTGFSYRLPDYANHYWFDHLELAIKACPKGNFLDIGAGCGRLSLLLAQQFKEGMAVEVQIADEQLRNITQQAPNITFLQGNFLNLLHTLKNEKFDFILLAEVWEHIPEEEIPHFLDNLVQLLSIHGRLFITTPNAVVQGPAEKTPQWYKRQLYGHYKHYMPNEIEAILKKWRLSIDSMAFECGFFKSNVYNKLFYPCARMDRRLLDSKKVPIFIRKLYSILSMPIIQVLRLGYFLLAKVVYVTEVKYCNERTGITMMVLAKKTV